MLTIADLGVGWATDPNGGMKSWIENFTNGICNGPNMAARSRGNSGVNVVDFIQNAAVGPRFGESVIAYPTIEAARFAYRDTAFASYQCGGWTDPDTDVVTISDLPPLHAGSESVVKRLTWTVGTKYCDSGRIYEYDDYIELRLKAQFIRFELSTFAASSTTCGQPPPPPAPPDDKVLYALARRGISKYVRALEQHTKEVYAARRRTVPSVP